MPEEKNYMEELNKRLLQVQIDLKAPKNQKNSFGNYNYRSCEDILEALKPLLIKQELTLTIDDSLHQVGDRIYIQAIVKIQYKNFEKSTTAYAREAEIKKGMDEAQITGSASSYARKYALNGLFLIDDTKDSDTDEQQKQVNNTKEEKIPDTTKPPFFSPGELITQIHGTKNLKELTDLGKELKMMTSDMDDKTKKTIRMVYEEKLNKFKDEINKSGQDKKTGSVGAGNNS